MSAWLKHIVFVGVALAAVGCTDSSGPGVALPGSDPQDTSGASSGFITPSSSSVTTTTSGNAATSSAATSSAATSGSGTSGATTSAGGDSSGAASSGEPPASSTSGPPASSGTTASSAGPGSSSSGPVGPACNGSRDCQLGQLCLDGNCAPGCLTDNDCPGRQVCDAAAAPHGQCVECFTSTDCGQGQTCADGVCHPGCYNGMCQPPLVCRTSDNLCVECLDRRQCGPNQLCDAASNTCVDSTVQCQVDGDCGPAMLCTADGLCVLGCRANPPTCPPATFCDPTSGTNGLCQPGCQVTADCARDGVTCQDGKCVAPCARDTECPQGTVCASGACTPGCRLPDRGCPQGLVCDAAGSGLAGQCISGCASSQDCGWFGGVCDTAAHQCVECLQPQDCNAMGADNVQCSADHLCIIGCTPGQWDLCRIRGLYCDQATQTCVECTDATACQAGQTCTANRCVGSPQLGLCDECQTDAECGGDADLCVESQVGPQAVERVCGVDCSQGQACPLGTACRPAGGPTMPLRGYQCLPQRAGGPLSCAARRDLLDKKRCQGSQACGLFGGTDGDAICSGAGGSRGHCSYFCTVGGTECPEGFFCEDPPPANGQEFPPRCSPNP